MKRINLIYILLITMLLGVSACKNANVTQSTLPMWNRADNASITNSGVLLKIKFDEVKMEFVGTMENTNSTVAINARVEVHTFDPNGNQMFEYGPTTPVNMQPGEILNIVLPAANAGNFIKFTMHPEVG